MMNFSAKEIEYLADFEKIMNCKEIDQFYILKTMTKLLFCLFKQVSQFQLLFAEMKQQIEKNAEKSAQSIDQIRKQISNIENNKIANIISNINQHHQEILTKFDNIEYGTEVQDFEPDFLRACEYGKSASVRWLAEKENVDINKKGRKGKHGIHLAAKNGQLSVVQYLIEKQNVNIEIPGFRDSPPLHYACKNGHLPVVKYLISKGANVNSIDCNKWTPLHYAAYYNHIDVVKCLLSNGADKNIYDNSYKRPYHYVKKNDEMEKLLQYYKYIYRG